MRICRDGVIAIIGINGGKAASGDAIDKFLVNSRIKYVASGEPRCFIIANDEFGPAIFFSNLGADTVRRHLNSDGFIFI